MKIDIYKCAFIIKRSCIFDMLLIMKVKAFRGGQWVWHLLTDYTLYGGELIPQVAESPQVSFVSALNYKTKITPISLLLSPLASWQYD
jgi:hypothetical protein